MGIREVDVLITLLGSNPLVPVTSIKSLPSTETTVFIYHSKNTSHIFRRIVEWGQKYSNSTQIYGIEIEPFDPEDIIAKSASFFDEHPIAGKIELNTTGGTKQMMLGVLLFLQDYVKEQDKLVTSYTINYPWELQVTDIYTKKSQTHPITAKYSIKEIIGLHQDKVRSKNPASIKTHDMLASKIIDIVSEKKGGDRWNFWKKDHIEPYFRRGRLVAKEQELLQKSISFSKFPELKKYIHPNSPSIGFQELFQVLEFRSAKQLVDWLNGFWLETYVASVFKRKALSDLVDDVKINIVAEAPQFEIDLIFLVKNQLFVTSVSTTTDAIPGGNKFLKKKIFEVIIRSRQIAGWKSHFSLICLADNLKRLETEVEDYLVDRKIKVFGRQHLKSLDEHICSWILNQ